MNAAAAQPTAASSPAVQPESISAIGTRRTLFIACRGRLRVTRSASGPGPVLACGRLAGLMTSMDDLAGWRQNRIFASDRAPCRQASRLVLPLRRGAAATD